MTSRTTTRTPPRFDLRADVPASLVVFLVALPLSLGIAIASGAPLMAGLIAAVVGGVVAGLIGGSPLQVSGPAAGLTVVVAELVQTFGWQVTCFITAVAGLLQIALGFSRVARQALAIAPVVVHAMLAGIGITIALQQAHVLLGGDSRSTPVENATALPAQLLQPHTPSLLVGLLVIVIMLSWPRLPAVVRKVPGALVAIVVATLVAAVWLPDVRRVDLNGSMVDALQLPALPSGDWTALVLGIVTVTLIASVESLLSAVAVDKMHTGPRTQFDRELVGQGAANSVSGLIGGLPVTGVIVRSSTNVASGARTRASAVLHGVWVLVFSVALAGLVRLIPLAALAGLLIVVGIQLVKLAHLRLAARTGDMLVYAVTVVAVVVLNLLEGVLIGLLLAALILLLRISRAGISAHAVEGATNQWHVNLAGSLSFLSLPRLTQALESVPEQARVTMTISADYLDSAVAESITEWLEHHRRSGGTVAVEEVGPADLAAATTSRAQRSHAHHRSGSLIAPWGEVAEPSAAAHRGVADFHARTADALRPHLEPLADSQAPSTLFLTCVDSRVVPNIITSSGPGDLLTVRNVGNLVPADGSDLSVEAALAFGVEQVGIRELVVCGHSACGAMRATLAAAESDTPPGEGPVETWLGHAAPVLDDVRRGHPAARAAAELGFDEADQMSVVNVARQVAHLRQHPVVGPAVERGDVVVRGLWFHIADAEVLEVTAGGFEPVVHAPVHPH